MNEHLPHGCDQDATGAQRRNGVRDTDPARPVRSTERLDNLLAPDFVEIGASAPLRSKAEIIRGLVSGTRTERGAIEPSEITGRAVGPYLVALHSSPQRVAGECDAVPISFRSTAIQADGDQWRVIGAVTAHGSTQPVEITVDRATASGTDITIHAVAQIDRYAFGVTGVKGMAGRHVTIDFDLIAATTSTSAGSL